MSAREEASRKRHRMAMSSTNSGFHQKSRCAPNCSSECAFCGVGMGPFFLSICCFILHRVESPVRHSKPISPDKKRGNSGTKTSESECRGLRNCIEVDGRVPKTDQSGRQGWNCRI